MQNLLRSSRALSWLSVLALVFVPACGGGGGGNNGGGATGGTSNPFSPTDLAGAWTGTLVPRANAGLPWSDGEKRILSRNFVVRADGQGNFQFCLPGTEETYDVVAGTARVSQSEIGTQGRFSVTFKELQKNREQLVLVGRLNKARNRIVGEYELRSRTENTTGNEVEAVDAGDFELLLSSGVGHFQPSDLEGTWSGRNYHYAPRYSNMSITIDSNGSVTAGGIETASGTHPFALDGSNDLLFGLLTDTSIGMIENVVITLESGVQVKMLYALVDDGGRYITGPLEDNHGKITYFRLVRQ